MIIAFVCFDFYINNMKKEERNESESGAKKRLDENWWRPAFVVFSKFFGWIIFPPLIGAKIGMWLDKKYDSEPWLFLVSVGVAFILAMIGLVKNATKEFKKLDNLNKKDARK